MDKNIWMAVVVLFCMLSCSRNKHIDYYPNGSIKWTVEMKDGKREGRLI